MENAEKDEKIDSQDMYGRVRYEVSIPKARVAVLIGKGGETKKRIESETKTKLIIDSTEGDVIIDGTDVIMSYMVRDIVKAIGRGFNPDIALLLLKPDYSFELVDLSEFSGSKSGMLRLKGRVIGQEGKTRFLVEKLIEVNISVFGKTIAIIGLIERTMAARQAIEMLLRGSTHASVYKWLEKKRHAFTKTELLGDKVEIKDNFKKYVQ